MFGDAIASHLIIGQDKSLEMRSYLIIATPYILFYDLFAVFRKNEMIARDTNVLKFYYI